MPSPHKKRFIDVIFPQNINRLTYILPADISAGCHIGDIVEAPIRGKTKYGVVVRTYNQCPAGSKGIKFSSISGIVDRYGLNEDLVKLLEWVSEYYMCKEGLALKNLLFTDTLNLTRNIRAVNRKKAAHPSVTLPDTTADFQTIRDCILKRRFQTVLFHSKSMISGISIIINIIKQLKNIIIIIPEKHDLELFLPFLQLHADGRYCVLHGNLNKGLKSDAYSGIYSGRYDIVIGTMQTVFAPMPKPSMIVVFKEHSDFYKHEGTPMYNVRDVAVKRGSIGNFTVLLTSMSPSFESYNNCIIKKYKLISDSVPTSRPHLRIINAAGSRTIISSPLRKGIEAMMKENKDVLLILNRMGHSILRCNECGHIDVCPECGVPLVFHSEKVMRCHYCNRTMRVHDLCPACRSIDLRLVGSGTEKAFELLKKEFSSDIALIDSEHAGNSIAGAGGSRIIIGTEFALRRIRPFSKFGITAVLNSDISLQRPDFRVYEKLFRNLIYLSQHTVDGGEMFIQTFDWKNPLFGFVKKFDYAGFFSKEIEKRKDFNYPPFRRIALLSVKKSSYIDDYSGISDRNTELLGPIQKKTGKSERVEFMIKCNPKVQIQGYVDMLRKKISKNLRDLKIDIDPLMFG
ncbi:primosomal protein N' [bacterium BMS3Abin07]|nr:primosomal protein N' [bacterium BMS3Abin07]GBE32102.1 primosomal protein N' [bacterium BMS3Bbin05]